MLIFLLGLASFSPLIISYAAREFSHSRSLAWDYLGPRRRLASDSLMRNPVRSGITVATMVISLAAIFTIAAFVNSVRGSLLLWIDQMVTADIIVSSGASTAGPRNVSLREEPLPGLQALPGVKIVDLYRLVRANYQGRPIVVESFSAAASARVRTLPMAEGDGSSRAAGNGAKAKAPSSAKVFRLASAKISTTALNSITPSGPATFKVLGIYIDYSSDIGSVLIDRALYKKYWRDESGRCLRSVVGTRRGHGGGDSKDQGWLRRALSALYQHAPANSRTPSCALWSSPSWSTTRSKSSP